MFYFDPQAHFEGLAGLTTLQMGQPADDLPQRQQTDDVFFSGTDAHGVDRELQFADSVCRTPQAMG